jgi:hypothetical protein
MLDAATPDTRAAIRKVLDHLKADQRTSLTAPEGKLVCDAFGIPVPKEGLAKFSNLKPVSDREMPTHNHA